jgi:hypothetical protein
MWQTNPVVAQGSSLNDKPPPVEEAGAHLLGGEASNEGCTDFVPCVMAIAAVCTLCSFVVFVPGVIGTSNGAGILTWFGTPAITVLAAFALADRSRWCGWCCWCGGWCGAFSAASGAAAFARAASARMYNTSRSVSARASARRRRGWASRVDFSPAVAGDWSNRPKVFESADDPEYLRCCKDAAAELERAVLAKRTFRGQESLEKKLEKHGLRFSGPDVEQGEVAALSTGLTDFNASAKALRSLVMRFPASKAPLSQGNFQWALGHEPLRAGPAGPAELDAVLATWTEKTTSAVDSALFSSDGIWISPHAVPLAALSGIVLAGIAVTRVFLHNGAHWKLFPFGNVSNVTSSFACIAMAAALRAGRRPLAKRCWFWGQLLTALCLVLEGAFAACKCWGAYGETHAPTGDTKIDSVSNYPWCYVVSKVLTGLSVLSLVALATHPHRSFGMLFVAFPVLNALAYSPYLADYSRFYTYVWSAAAGDILLGLGAFLWCRRALALEYAKELDKEDTVKYEQVWKELVAEEGFSEELRDLRRAWGDVQASAAHDDAELRSAAGTGVPRQQDNQRGVGALFREADDLNDVLQVKLHDVCELHGGKLLRSDVKGESRALQKVFRTYGEHWWRLSDLCRSSLVFDTVPQMAACLRAIGNDDELVVVPSDNCKMRLRKDFNAAELTGGYRDVQLTVLLKTNKTREKKTDRHLAEVHLHLAKILELKTAAGHVNYVTRRNLRGN